MVWGLSSWKLYFWKVVHFGKNVLDTLVEHLFKTQQIMFQIQLWYNYALHNLIIVIHKPLVGHVS